MVGGFIEDKKVWLGRAQDGEGDARFLTSGQTRNLAVNLKSWKCHLYAKEKREWFENNVIILFGGNLDFPKIKKEEAHFKQ